MGEILKVHEVYGKGDLTDEALMEIVNETLLDIERQDLEWQEKNSKK